jgi:hypothetical protein
MEFTFQITNSLSQLSVWFYELQPFLHLITRYFTEEK